MPYAHSEGVFRPQSQEGCNETQKMYPKVKVREESEAVAIEDDRSGALDLKGFQSLLREDEHTENTPALARIPESYVPNLLKPSTAIKKGNKSREFGQHKSPPSLLMEKNSKSVNDDDDDDNRPNIRASPVPRPRAVLSSPDNDGVIGSRNWLSKGKQTTLKRGEPGNRRSPKLGVPVDARRVTAEAENNNHKATKPTPIGRTGMLRETQNKSKIIKHLTKPVDAEPRTERAKPEPSWR